MQYDSKKIEIKDIETIKNDYYKYVFSIAKYFYDLNVKYEDCEKFKIFCTKLAQFIKDEKENNRRVHIATLNYDKMLYSKLLKENILINDYAKTCMVDGFRTHGFDDTNLYEKYPHKFGLYLHLHGTPLYFLNNEDKVEKSRISDNIECEEKKRYQIILCEPDQKLKTIAHSEVLSSYFLHFRRIIQDCNVIIIGYGGRDVHVNNTIKEIDKCTKITIIDNFELEEDKWKERLGDKRNLEIKKQEESILNYNFPNILHS